MAFQAACYTLPCAAYRVRWQARCQVAPPTIPINCLKDNDCSVTLCAAIMIVKVKWPSQHRRDKAPNTRKALPQLIKRGGKGEFTREVPKKGVFSLIINLTRASEGVSEQVVRTSFARKEKEATLSIDWATIPGRHVTSRGSRHQHWRHLWKTT